MTLKLTAFTFENAQTGNKVTVDLPQGFICEFDKPFPEDSDAAYLLSGVILAGAYSSSKDFLTNKEKE